MMTAVFNKTTRIFMATKYGLLHRSLQHSVWTPEKNVKSPFKDINLPNKTVTEHVWENLERWPDKTALICSVTGRSMTFNCVYKYSKIFGAQLRTKFRIENGDVVGIMMNNVPEYAPVVLGAVEAGAVVTTIGAALTPGETKRQLSLSNPKVLIGMPETIPVLKTALSLIKKEITIICCHVNSGLPSGIISFQELVEENHVDIGILEKVSMKPEDVVFLPFSSGTTGLPKAVELTHNNIVSNSKQQDEKEIRHYDDTTNTNQDTILAIRPFGHIYGLSINMIHKLSVGCKLVTVPVYIPENVLSALENFKINLMPATPSIVLYLVSNPHIKPKHFESVKRITCGAALLPKVDIENILSKATNTQLLQIYGMTEASPSVATSRAGTTNYTSAGVAVPNTELKIVDSKGVNLGPNKVGELYIRGPQVMKGFRDNYETTTNCITEDGWLKSGDLASIDEDGSITIRGRLKEIIKVYGYPVAPAELEHVIKEHPAVLDVGVVGVPDTKFGEQPKAFVVLKDGHKAAPSDIAQFADKRVAFYKKLKEVTILDSLPKNSSGKLLRRVLTDKYC